MISIGNFFYRYRNVLFIFLYLLLFIPSPKLFKVVRFGEHYYYWPIIVGLIITVTGQLIRGVTIGLAYIVRGGKDGKVYADDLVTAGIFNHSRNPLYLGNILMLLGVGILSNSLIYVLIVMPIFLLIYQTIVLTEENFLSSKFKNNFDDYCRRVNRWMPSLRGLRSTFSSMEFKWKRWLIKEYNTQYVWLTGITLVLFLNYPQLTNNDPEKRNHILIFTCIAWLLYYLFVRYMKKTRKWQG